MHIDDVYKHKEFNSFIHIDSFATNLDLDKTHNEQDDLILYIIVNQLELIDNEIAYSPSSNKFTTEEYINQNYVLYSETSKLNQKQRIALFDDIERILLLEE